MAITNKKLGNGFETRFCEILSDHGFWCHNMAQNQSGQPADVIAVRNKNAYLIDCKVCSKNSFPLSRIEENQRLAMTLWKNSGNGEGWFALEISQNIYMVSARVMRIHGENHSVLTLKDIMGCGITLDGWVRLCR